MLILGINSSHNATASLLKDGKILACISEERMTRVKNQVGLPVLAIKECLRIAGVEINQVDYLILNFIDPKVNGGFSTFKESKNRIVSKPSSKSLSKILLYLMWLVKEQLLTLLPQSKYLLDQILKITYALTIDPKMEEKTLAEIESKLGIPRSKVIKNDHHTSHALAAFYASPFPKSAPTLLFTLDSSGDGVCSTVSIAQDGVIKRIATTPSGSSLSDLYLYTTVYLGMTPVEHEHKVMGLAAYSEQKHYQSALNKIKDLLRIKSDLTFESKIHSHMFYKILPKLFALERFDNVAGAVQKYTEDMVCEWIALAIKKTGISTIVCGGGTFMNVKVNQRISEMKEVKEMFIMPSASDESTAIGAAYWGYQQQKNTNSSLPEIEPLKDLYLGGEFSDEYIGSLLKDKKYKEFTILKPADIESKIASLLAKGEIVARFANRSEWGARAMGNRSILAHPSKLEVIPKINKQIKSRDFWMPFAPSILDEEKDKYFINKKDIDAPYMIVTFDSTEKGAEELIAATHLYDHTLRPQVVYSDWNPTYHHLIQEFKKETRVGGVLNTSFNLHGFPIVYYPEDALYVFENSGLKYLALGSFLIAKK